MARIIAMILRDQQTQHSASFAIVQYVRDCYINGRYSMVKLEEYVLDSLMRDLVGHDRRPVSYLVYLWLAAEQQRQRKAVSISYSDLAESVGVSKSAAQSAVAWLIHRKLISSTKATVTATPSYTVQTPWKVDYPHGASRAPAYPSSER
jgi:hypothetical protein